MDLRHIKRIIIFAAVMVIVNPSGGTIEKGIRCKTGTVPAAVSLIKFLSYHCHCLHDGKALRKDESEDLP